MCDSPELLAALGRIEQHLTARPVIDQTFMISDTQGVILDYKDRRHVYVFSETALTLNVPGIGTYPLTAQAWTGLEFREKTKLFTSGQASPVMITLRASDDTLLSGVQPVSGTLTATQGTSPWVTSVSNVNANGQNTSVNSSPVVLASDQLPVAAALADGTANPTLSEIQTFPMVFNGTTWDRWIADTVLKGVAVTEDVIRQANILGKGFSYFTGKQTAPGASTLGFQVFNNSSAKNILIYSIIILQAAAGFIDVRATTANVNTIVGWTDSVITPVNNKGGGGASVATSSFSNTNVTGAALGTSRSLANAAANAQVDLLTNGTCLLLPAGAANGLALYLTLAGATVWSVAAYGIEV